MVAHALGKICRLTKLRYHFDPWFVRQIKEIVDTEALVAARGLPVARSHAPCQSHGFFRCAAG